MDKLYSIQEVATKLNLADKTLRRWEEAGRFTPSRTLGNQRRYTLEDLQILDAIKHGTINTQKDLLTPVQASQLCGVSVSTLMRWEDNGKIHPFITSAGTYYPRQRLMEKMDELKSIAEEPEPIIPPPAPVESPKPTLSPLIAPPQPSTFDLRSSLFNIFITLILLISYHLIFNQPVKTVSPQGSVQGVSTVAPQDPRIDDLIKKFQDHLSSEMLKDAKPATNTTINVDGTALIHGSSTLSKGKNQISVSEPKITPTTPITLTFTSDYAPAKKYWVTTSQGSFTLNTDFPVSADSTFNYNFIAGESTQSAKKN